MRFMAWLLFSSVGKKMAGMKTETRKLLSPAEKKAQMLAMIQNRPKENRRPWMKHFGWAKDDPIYDEAMRLGAEYRRSQREE